MTSASTDQIRPRPGRRRFLADASTISFAAPAELRERLDQIAYRRRTLRSALIRELIEESLARRAKETKR